METDNKLGESATPAKTYRYQPINLNSGFQIVKQKVKLRRHLDEHNLSEVIIKKDIDCSKIFTKNAKSWKSPVENQPDTHTATGK